MNAIVDAKQWGIFFQEFTRILLLYAPRAFLAFAFVPLLSTKIVSTYVRNALVVSMVIIPVSLQYDQVVSIEYSVANYITLIIKECILGVFIGLLMALPFWVMDMMGTMIDNVRGATFASIFNPGTQSEDLVFSQFLILAGGVFILQAGYFAFMSKWLISTYFVFPVWSMSPESTLYSVGELIRAFSHVLLIAVLVVSPVVFAVLIVDFIFALLSAYVPNLQVYNLIFGLKSVVAILIVALYAYFLFHYSDEYFRVHTDFMARLIPSR
ncbi:EscT/YscT/HrcT family type III secretion system export apparatus protein [Limnobacter alexandrii]|uniref:EscT/YscT/HrcT family type III secretion system export apparatus protein n=1 Tax=Limnobacter alexandrii TaxID=2570352 RepID=UPI00110834C3|nr:flagellar biosynthetic protein FliR [Limnobacter alexandrii]